MSDQLSFDLSGGDPTSPLARPAVEPPDEAARARIRTDTGSTLFVEAGAGAGKTTALVGRILTLVDEGVPVEAIAAITFTEKAAAELRHALRGKLGAGAISEARQAALDGLDHAPVGTLHAFARRLLLEFPVEAGLPPGFDVLDELESQLALAERWEDLHDQLLDDAHRELAPGLTAADFVRLCSWDPWKGMATLRGIVDDFQANWDLVEERVDTTSPPPPVIDVSRIIPAAAAIGATATPAGDGQEIPVAEIAVLAERLRRAGSGLDQLEVLVQLRATADKLGRTGNKAKWRAFGDERALDELREREAELVQAIDGPLGQWRDYRRHVVGAMLGRFVLDGANDRAAAGTLEFHDLLVLARRLLTGATPAAEQARRALHDRYRRVLLDEFQDTDPIQLEIALRLTAPPAGQGSETSLLRPLPGRLFVVGDPKQSIYRFRRADISVYLRAAQQLGAGEVSLSANFRSTEAVIEWVNGVFATMITAEADVQPAYHPLDVAKDAPADHGTVHVLGADVHEEIGDEKVSADELRWREAKDVAAAVARALKDGWNVTDADAPGSLRACQPGDIAILLPARTSLPMLEQALADRDVPYRAENASIAYAAPEIRHLMLALRAAADPTDQLALVAALRSPLYGCRDVELYDWKQAGGSWNIFGHAPDGCHEHPVAQAIAHVRSIASRAARLGPAELVDLVVAERRLLETSLGARDARDVWRRVRYVVDQARAWTDAGGRGLRRYLQWTRFQAGSSRATETILPERDHDAVRIMTVHAAKGLQFPITVVAGMTTLNRGGQRISAIFPSGQWTLREKDDPLFEAFKPLDEQMSDAERRRLLYVACTRAVDHLVVSMHRKLEPASQDAGQARWSSASILAAHGADGFGAQRFDANDARFDRPRSEAAELPWADPDVWAAERHRVLRAAGTRTTSSATRIAATLPVDRPANVAEPAPFEPPVDDEPDLLSLTVDAGLAKDPVDLDLPPWQRGRYGTAIGRAVHAVLQDADLATGHDIDRLAESQAASEGIFGLEGMVATLARSALAAPIVRSVGAGAEHWRELFVVAELGTTVMEGYIDLLVRTPAGLVIVDYKTDHFTSEDTRAERLARYRLQLAAYALALGRILDEPIAGGVLVHCQTDGAAEQLDVPEWPAALATVGAALAVPA